MDNKTTIEKISDTEYVRKNTVVVSEQTNLVEAKQHLQSLKDQLAQFEADNDRRVAIKRQFIGDQINALTEEIAQAESLGIKEPEPTPESDPAPIDPANTDVASDVAVDVNPQ